MVVLRNIQLGSHPFLESLDLLQSVALRTCFEHSARHQFLAFMWKLVNCAFNCVQCISKRQSNPCNSVFIVCLRWLAPVVYWVLHLLSEPQVMSSNRKNSYFSHRASAFSKLRSLAKCPLTLEITRFNPSSTCSPLS